MNKRQVTKFNTQYRVCNLSVVVRADEVSRTLDQLTEFAEVSSVGCYVVDIGDRPASKSERELFECEYPYPIFEDEETE